MKHALSLCALMFLIAAAPASSQPAPKTIADMKKAVAAVKIGDPLTDVEAKLGKSDESQRRGNGTVRWWVRTEGKGDSRARYSVKCFFGPSDALVTLDEINE